MKSVKIDRTLLLSLSLIITSIGCSSVSAPEISGSEIYWENCASCHGVDGEGQPGWQIQRADGTYPAPPHNSSGHTWHHSDGYLFRIVKGGGESLNAPNYASGMPAFEDLLADEEIKAVIEHLKTFWNPEQRKAQARASEADSFPE